MVGDAAAEDRAGSRSSNRVASTAILQSACPVWAETKKPQQWPIKAAPVSGQIVQEDFGIQVVLMCRRSLKTSFIEDVVGL